MNNDKESREQPIDIAGSTECGECEAALEQQTHDNQRHIHFTDELALNSKLENDKKSVRYSDGVKQSLLLFSTERGITPEGAKIIEQAFMSIGINIAIFTPEQSDYFLQMANSNAQSQGFNYHYVTQLKCADNNLILYYIEEEISDGQLTQYYILVNAENNHLIALS